MKIGVVGYTVRFHTFTPRQVESAYQRISALGYNGVENPLGRKFFSPKEELDLLGKYNLSIASAAGANIQKPDEAMRISEEYGTKLLSIPSIPGEMMHSVDGFMAFAQQINEWAKPFKGTGYRLQYHNHSQEFRNFPELGGKNGMQLFIEETDPEVVCFELDTHWTAAAGCDPARWIRDLKGRIHIVHFKDYAIDYKATDTDLGSVPKRFAEIGQGNINWPGVAQACKEAGAEWVCVEQDLTVLNPFDCLKISIDYINKLGLR